MAPLAQDETRSNIRGKIGSAILPASDTYWDMNEQAFVTTDEPRKVGNVTGGSWHGVVSSLSDAPETTYAFWSLMAVKPISKWLATYGWNGVDPGYDYQFLEPVGEAKLEDYLAAGWDETDVQDYLQAYYENFNAEVMLPYLRITGTQEYYDILDSEPVGGDERREDAAAGARRHGRRLGAGHRPARPREAAGGLSGRDRLAGLSRPSPARLTRADPARPGGIAGRAPVRRPRPSLDPRVTADALDQSHPQSSS